MAIPDLIGHQWPLLEDELNVFYSLLCHINCVFCTPFLGPFARSMGRIVLSHLRVVHIGWLQRYCWKSYTPTLLCIFFYLISMCILLFSFNYEFTHNMLAGYKKFKWWMQSCGWHMEFRMHRPGDGYLKTPMEPVRRGQYSTTNMHFIFVLWHQLANVSCKLHFLFHLWLCVLHTLLNFTSTIQVS